MHYCLLAGHCPATPYIAGCTAQLIMYACYCHEKQWLQPLDTPISVVVNWRCTCTPESLELEPWP